MAASTVTYDTKVQSIDPSNPANEKWRATDANEVKTVVNANATLLDTNTTNIATNTSNIATNTSNISTNTSSISTNTSNIATNTSNIATNTTNIATNTTNIANKVELGGDIGGTITTPTINNQAVTNAKLANIPTNRIKGRATAGSGVVEDLTVSQTKTMLSLDQVDNTSDLDKPISTAVATALATKLTASNNLSDLTNAATARTNLGVVAQTGDESLRAYRPVGTTITASNALSDACATANTFYAVDTSSSAVTITVGDTDAGTVGFEYEFFVTDATNGISFAVSGSQSVISEDAYLTRTTVGGLMLKYIATNTWVLLGATS